MQLILDFDEFDTFYEFINKIRTIKVNEENWKLSKCNCCYWLKNNVCIHIIIIAVDLKKAFFKSRSIKKYSNSSKYKKRSKAKDKKSS
jgi:hypothetical protein